MKISVGIIGLGYVGLPIIRLFTSKKITVGKIPIMTQSSFCILHDIPQVSFNTIGECKYDVGGYFIINV